ncbi:MAG TPA: patatin-like phospholipase family protein [Thermosynechococcaceae cyanobacterium]
MTTSYRILSLSGGGVRGLMTAIWLNRLEQKLGSPLHQHFDLIAGTSTGAIIACALAVGKSTEEIVQLYRDRGREIFPPQPKQFFSRVTRVFSQGVDAPRYDGQGLEKVLRDEFKDDRFESLKVHTLITSYDLLHREALVLKTNKPEHQPLLVWQVAKASASAPVYFPAQLLTLAGEPIAVIDGGVVANNPTACAIAEAVRLNSGLAPEAQTSLAEFVVASFGTGEITQPITVRQSQEWGALGWVIPLIDVLFDGSADSVDYIARQLLEEANYFRFQTPVREANPAIDDASPKNIADLTRIAERYLDDEADALLDRLVQALQKVD